MNDKTRRKCPRIKRERDDIVGNNIRKYRTLMGMSQDGLAKELGLTFQQVQKYERATNRVSSGTLYDISLILGVPITWLFYNDEDTKKIMSGDLPSISNIEKPIFTDSEVELIRLLRKANQSMKTGILRILNSYKGSKEEN